MKEKKKIFSLTKDNFKITYFSGSGAGGQHRNRHNNCVRIEHKESGVTKTGQSHKSLHQNREEAFKNLVGDKKFMAWIKRKVSEVMSDGKELEKKVEKLMDEKFIKVEQFNKKKNKWEKYNAGSE